MEIGQRGEESLDIGCAYGVAPLAALRNGVRVCACDIKASFLANPMHKGSGRQHAGVVAEWH